MKNIIKITKKNTKNLLATHKSGFLGTTTIKKHSLQDIVRKIINDPDFMGEIRNPIKNNSTFIIFNTGSRLYFEPGRKYYQFKKYIFVVGSYGIIIIYRLLEKIEKN